MPSLTKHIKRIIGRALNQSSDRILTNGQPPRELSQTQEMFIAWNAQRLNISADESKARYFTSWSALRNGHAGREYRAFNDLSYQLFQVFSNDAPTEVYAAYAMHAPMHFLRMLSYPEPQWQEDNVVMKNLR
jgi:hypothetical protein